MHRLFYRSLLLFQGIVLFTLQCQGAAVSGQMPFNSLDGYIWVKVDVPGLERPLSFVVDSGASSTVVNLETAKKLRLSFGKATSVRGMQGRATAWWLKDFSAHLCGHALTATPLALDLEPVSRLCHRRIDGLIGADFLRGRRLQLDPSTGKLRFGSSCKPVGKDAKILKLKRRGDAWCAAARVDGNSSKWFRIDSGHDGGLAWYPGEDARVRPDGVPRFGFSRGEPDAATVVLDFGTFKTEGVEMRMLQRAPFPGEAGLLGNAFLSRYRVTFDLARNQLILESLE